MAGKDPAIFNMKKYCLTLSKKKKKIAPEKFRKTELCC